jgi:hypothetical protein
VLSLAGILVGVGCRGNLDGPLGPTGSDQQAGGATGPDSTAGSGDFASGNFDAARCDGRKDIAPGKMPGLVRLTHRQYDFAVHDVLGLDARAQAEFVKDQAFYGFDNNAAALSVAPNQVTRYQATAERLAGEAVADLGKLSGLAPCLASGTDDACRDTFIDTFLERMFRRPPSDDEHTRYATLFAGGKDLYEDGSALQRGVRIVIEAALQSPSFLYRAELRDAPLDGATVALTDHELAARLALTLWSSLPDAALLSAAKAGALTDDKKLEAQVRRMLADPKAARMVEDFHAQWLEFDKLRFEKSAAAFPGYDAAAFAVSAKNELLAFARYMSLESKGTFADLFSAPIGFVDQTLASIYGLSGNFGSTPQKVELDAAQRAGIFTSAGFLSGRSDAIDSSPIYRGAYLQKQVLCKTFGSPPPNVGTVPPAGATHQTTRQRVETKTQGSACQTCHGVINPTGFAFEHFDAIGRAREQDQGQPIDAKGTLTLDGKSVSFDGAAELAAELAHSDTAARCYETQWFRYTMARGEADDDVCLLAQLDSASAQNGRQLNELIVALAMSRGFRFRAQEDL